MTKVTVVRTANQLNPLLTQASASATYLSKVSASSTYLTQTSASSLYLTQSSALSEYLPQSSASSLYLTQTSASNIYPTKGSVELEFLSKSSASTIYATKASPTFTGTVTMPDQPSFLAVRSGNLVYNPATPVIFNSAVYNLGNNYNVSSGLFTAPVSGNYIFQVGVYQSVAVKQIWFTKNGSRERNLITDSSTNTFVQGMGMIYLSSGDNLGIISFSSSTNPTTIYADTNYTYFRGQLVN